MLRSLIGKVCKSFGLYACQVMHGRGALGTLLQDLALVFVMYIAVCDNPKGGIPTIIFLSTLVLGCAGTAYFMLCSKASPLRAKADLSDDEIADKVASIVREHARTQPMDAPTHLITYDLNDVRKDDWALMGGLLETSIAASLMCGVRIIIFSDYLSTMLTDPQGVELLFCLKFAIISLAVTAAMIAVANRIAARKLDKSLSEYVHKHIIAPN